MTNSIKEVLWVKFRACHDLSGRPPSQAGETPRDPAGKPGHARRHRTERLGSRWVSAREIDGSSGESSGLKGITLASRR